MANLPGTRIRDNGVFGTITDNPLTMGATTFNSADLADLSVVAGDHAIVTLDPLREFGDSEIIMVTAHSASATVATIQRGMFGTAARQHPVNTLWVHAATNDDFIRIVTSSTRPADPYKSQVIFETDTNYYMGHTGSAWEHGLKLGTWTDWTPTLDQNGAVTKTVTYAAYVRIGRTVIASMVLSVTGTGNAGQAVTVGLPPIAPRELVVAAGTAYLLDSSAGTRYAGTNRIISTGFQMIPDASTSGVLGTNGFTAALASGDVIAATLIYEAAS